MKGCPLHAIYYVVPHMCLIVKILNLYIILSCTTYHFFPVSIHSMQCIHCLLQLCYKIFSRHLTKGKACGNHVTHSNWSQRLVILCFQFLCLLFLFFSLTTLWLPPIWSISWNSMAMNDGSHISSVIMLHYKLTSINILVNWEYVIWKMKQKHATIYNFLRLTLRNKLGKKC